MKRAASPGEKRSQREPDLGLSGSTRTLAVLIGIVAALLLAVFFLSVFPARPTEVRDGAQEATHDAYR